MKKATAYRRFFALLRMAILALVVLGGLSMCGKNEVVAHEEDPWIDLCGDQPIRFSSFMATPATKTDPLVTDLPHSTVFGVFGFYQPGVIGQSSGSWSQLETKNWIPNFMYNQVVSYDTDHWSCSPIKYWPNNGENTLTFWAYAPHPQDGDNGIELLKKDTEEDYDNITVGIPDIGFDVRTNNGQTDLMVSDIVQDQHLRDTETEPVVTAEPTDGIVPLLFHHILCKIDFRVQKAEGVSTVIKLKSISFRQLYLTGTHPGTYNYSWDVTGDRGTGIAWSDDNGHVLPAYSTDPVDLVNSYVATYMPIPQELGDLEDEETARVLLHVEYSVGSSSGTTGADYPLYLALHEDNEWKQNTHYTYTLRISPSDTYIEFSAAIEPWGATVPWVYHHVD